MRTRNTFLTLFNFAHLYLKFFENLFNGRHYYLRQTVSDYFPISTGTDHSMITVLRNLFGPESI